MFEAAHVTDINEVAGLLAKGLISALRHRNGAATQDKFTGQPGEVEGDARLFSACGQRSHIHITDKAALGCCNGAGI